MDERAPSSWQQAYLEGFLTNAPAVSPGLEGSSCPVRGRWVLGPFPSLRCLASHPSEAQTVSLAHQSAVPHILLFMSVTSALSGQHILLTIAP